MVVKPAVSKASSVLRRAFSTWEVLRTFRSNPLADMSSLARGLVPAPIHSGAEREDRILDRILAAYAAATNSMDEMPAAYRVGGVWAPIISLRRTSFGEALTNQDRAHLGSLLRGFFRNSGLASLASYAYYENIKRGGTTRKKRFVNDVLRDYAVWRDLVGEATPSVLSPPPVGDPWGYVVDGTVVMADSLRHDSYAWRAHDLLAGIDRPVVAEIGGGYGGFAYSLLMRNSNVTYINFDLPEILAVASYYLMSAFPEKNVLLFGESRNLRIEEDSIASHDIVLMPNHQLPNLASGSVDMFVNTRSLSEMPYDTIAEYLRQVGRTCRRYFFHENSEHEKEYVGGHVEVPSSRFPMPDGIFRRIYRAPSPWAGGRSRYWELLYERTDA